MTEENMKSEFTTRALELKMTKSEKTLSERQEIIQKYEQEWKAMTQKMFEIANIDKVSEEDAQRLLSSSPTSVTQDLKKNVDDVRHKVIKLKLKLAKAEKAAADAAAQLLTVTQALETSHNHVRRLTADTAEPKARMQIMCTFLRTYHNANITFDQ